MVCKFANGEEWVLDRGNDVCVAKGSRERGERELCFMCGSHCTAIGYVNGDGIQGDVFVVARCVDANEMA